MIRCSRESRYQRTEETGETDDRSKKDHVGCDPGGRWSSCKEIYYEASKRDPGDRQGNGVPDDCSAGRNRRFKPLPQYSLRNEDELSSITSDAS